MPGAIRSEDPAPTQYESVQKFADWGFKISPLMVRAKSVEELVAHYQLIEEQRSSLGYDIDGVVYKVDQLELQRRWGFVTGEPRWAIAHKFPAEQAMTTVLQDRHPGRPHRHAGAGCAARAGHGRRRRGRERHAAQRGLHQGPGQQRPADPRRHRHPHRRHGRHPAGRGRHSADRQRRHRQASGRCRALRIPAHLSDLRLAGDARDQREDRQGRFAPALHRRTDLRRAGGGRTAPLRVARRDGHRRPGRRKHRPVLQCGIDQDSRRHLHAQGSPSRRHQGAGRAARGAGQAARGRIGQDAQECAQCRGAQLRRPRQAVRGHRRAPRTGARPFHLRARHPPYRRNDGRRACPNLLDHRGADPRRQGDGGGRRSAHRFPVDQRHRRHGDRRASRFLRQ